MSSTKPTSHSEDSGVLRDQIRAAQGPKVDHVSQVDFGRAVGVHGGNEQQGREPQGLRTQPCRPR